MLKFSKESWCPAIDPDKFVTHVVSSSSLIRLEPPKKASEVRCPNCGSDKGWFNPAWNAWSCLEDACISANSYCERNKFFGIEKKIYDFPIPDVPAIYHNASLRSCQQNETIKNQLHTWGQKPTEILILTGKPGRGKTYAASAVLNDYRSKEVPSERFCNVSELYLQWQLAQSQGMQINLLERLSETKLLVLDDLGSRVPTDAFLDFIYALINRRINSNRGMLLTTNLSSDDLQRTVGDVIVSRLLSGKAIVFVGPDKRLGW